MRAFLAFPLLRAAAGCNVQNDTGNDSVTLEYNQQRIEDAAAAAARTAKEVGAGVGNVAASAGSAIKNEVGDIDVDVDVNRTKTEAPEANQTAE